MVNYQNAKIYKLVSYVNDDIYIGSTCEALSTRMSKHRYNYNKYLNKECNYVTSYKILETGYYDIILIEKYPCNSKEELHARERFHIENNNCVNQHIPTRTHKEYYEQHKEIINKTKINCPICNLLVNRPNILRHQKSKKCLEANKNIL